MKASPIRRKMGGARKVQFTPKKKSPSKTKRGVRWRDHDENGELAEFRAPPPPAESTPTSSSIELPTPPTSSAIPVRSPGSSPVPTPPKSSLDIQKPRSSRFQTGFLLKKADGSPNGTTSKQFSSDSGSPLSPLREIGSNTVRLSSLGGVERAASQDAAPSDSCGDSSGSDNEKLTMNKSDAHKISSAIKRRSSTSQGAMGTVARAHRRRSPTAASSPPNENNMFSASAARRMVKSERDPDWKTSVLSPRSAPILKGAARRTTMATAGDERPGSTGSLERKPIRVISGSRGSLMPGSKNIWR